MQTGSVRFTDVVRDDRMAALIKGRRLRSPGLAEGACFCFASAALESATAKSQQQGASVEPSAHADADFGGGVIAERARRCFSMRSHDVPLEIPCRSVRRCRSVRSAL
jgi:hypothetical protein